MVVVLAVLVVVVVVGVVVVVVVAVVVVVVGVVARRREVMGGGPGVCVVLLPYDAIRIQRISRTSSSDSITTMACYVRCLKQQTNE